MRAYLDRHGWAGRVHLDSAGTHGWHAGEPPDKRAIACARGHGVDIAGLRARQLCAADFADFDWLLCADADNLRDVRAMAPRGRVHKTALLLDWAAGHDGGAQVPDPYYGGPEDFEHAWALVDAAALQTVARLDGLQGHADG